MPMDLAINIQAFTRGLGVDGIEFSGLKKKLDLLFDSLDIENVIIGWANNKKLYEETKEYLEKRKAKMLLWFPVFSELGYFREFQPVVDFRGNKISSYKLQEGENFEFYCPTNKDNLRNVIEIFEQEYFAETGFDGVFLDKIRYPSLSNGMNSVFSCFCPECKKAMADYGIDVDELLHELADMIEDGPEFKLRKQIPIRENSDFTYEFENPVLKKFFDFKNHNICSSVEKLCSHFKEKNLIVGLDVFAGSIAYFVGQDLRKLADHADFIKPMYYRKTNAPAGMQFELNNIFKVFTLMGNSTYPDFNEKNAFGYDRTLKELKALKALDGKTRIYPGFEVNRIDNVAPVYPDYVSESMKLVEESGMKGAVISWDIMNAPEDNIGALINILARKIECFHYWSCPESMDGYAEIKPLEEPCCEVNPFR